MIRNSKYTLLAMAGVALLSMGLSKQSDAAGLASMGAAIGSSASSVASFADGALGKIQDYTCKASMGSSLLTGFVKDKALGAAKDAMGDFGYSSEVMRELRKTTPSVNECHNTERGKALRNAMMDREAVAFAARWTSWEKRKGEYNERGLTLNEPEPKFNGANPNETGDGFLTGLVKKIKGEKKNERVVTRTWNEREMWVNQPSWGSDLMSSVVADGIHKIASKVSDDPATQALIGTTLNNGVSGAIQ